jgi:hypothetical protein
VTDYARAEIVGPAEALMLEADATELLVTSLDELLELLEARYQSADADAHELAHRIDAIAELRDAVHSAVTDPVP